MRRTSLLFYRVRDVKGKLSWNNNEETKYYNKSKLKFFTNTDSSTLRIYSRDIKFDMSHILQLRMEKVLNKKS